MMRTNTDGLILKEQNIGEKDKLVTVLTRHNGLVRAFVRGAKSFKNRKNSATGMFCYSKLSLYKTKDAYIIEEAEPVETFFGLREDLEKIALAQYFSELVMMLVQEDEPAEEYLRLILNSLHFLAKDKMPLSLTFLRNCFEGVDNDKYEKLDDMLIQELSDYDIRYIGFIVGDKNAGKNVEEKWVCNNPKHVVLVLPLEEPEEFVKQAFDKAKTLLTETPEIL